MTGHDAPEYATVSVKVNLIKHKVTKDLSGINQYINTGVYILSI
jgi:hypothetical protein